MEKHLGFRSQTESSLVHSYDGGILCRIAGNILLQGKNFRSYKHEGEACWVVDRQLIDVAERLAKGFIMIKDPETGLAWVTVTTKVRRFGFQIPWGIGGAYALPVNHWFEFSTELFEFART